MERDATLQELRSRKAEDICFLIQKYSYSGKYRFGSTNPRYCLRFIDEPYQSVAKKLEEGGAWYFTLHPAYESSLISGNTLEILKELENVNNYYGGMAELENFKKDDELPKILLKFGLAGIEVKYMFTELDDKLEEIREIPSNKILYSVVDDKLILQMKKLGKNKSKRVAKKEERKEKSNGRHTRKPRSQS